MPSLLLVDDDPDVRATLGRAFERFAWEVTSAASAAEAVARYEDVEADVVVLDLQLPDRPGLEVLAELVDRGATVLVLTGHGDIPTAVEAMRRGAEHFLTKPIDLAHLVAAAERALDKARLRRAARSLAARLAEEHGFDALGPSPRMRALAQQLAQVAAAPDVTVLLLGESGTGKGWVARLLHAHSPRAAGPFVEINAAGLTPTFLASELFRHEKGAFTDAKHTKRGLFEEADGGTLFLDEVGDLAPELQPKLLTVLETKRFRRLGATRELQVDVRLIAATNRDLEAEVAAGRFREDLYYRLAVWPIRLPPLRERAPEDLVALVHRLLAELGRRLPGAPPAIAERALEALLAHSWPGNVRELRNVLERACVLARGQPEIRPEHLPAELRRGARPVVGGVRPLEDVEREAIAQALRTFGGNRVQAARALGIARATLYEKMRRYGLDDVGRGADRSRRPAPQG